MKINLLLLAAILAALLLLPQPQPPPRVDDLTKLIERSKQCERLPALDFWECIAP